MNRIKLVKTCPACPEQYDAYIDGQNLGYLRLRHGYFRAEYADKIVYSTGVPGPGGSFLDEDRVRELNAACRAILAAHWQQTGGAGPEIPEEPIYDLEDKTEE